ncbi:MAG: DUF2157 domain-containing protein, partial [Chloroflexi bacterium]|nr:DUF2157 domain-containing protein [Chloroflexota bacterium]
KPKKPTKPKKEKPPRQPWTWDRFWETLLSERTLQAILFLGALLIFAAGVSWVAWNWGTFPAIVQVAFLGGFTALFYALGWYVRVRLNLRGSGIALSAIGSLLVPLDFYAFYLSGGFPPDSWPMVWLAGSAVCLLIYLMATYLIQAEFFGYLVAVTAGSVVAAALNWMQVDAVWQPTGVAALALALAIISEGVRTSQRGQKWHVLAAPFDRMALLGAAATMILGLRWGLFAGLTRPFTLPLAFVYWLGGVTLALKVRLYRLRALVWGAALAFPVAVWLTERWFFLPTGIAAAWYAVGLALLTPVYLLVGYWFGSEENQPQRTWRTQREEDSDSALSALSAVKNFGRIPIQASVLLTAVSALWSLGDAAAAGWAHPILAAAMLLATRLWRQPRWLWLMSLFLLSGSAAWQGGRGATVPELALPWTLLAILFIAAAIRLRNAATRYDETLYRTGFAAAGLAILPPLFLFNQSLLTYALGNWIGVNGWLAYLSHTQKPIKIRVHPRRTFGSPSASQTILFQWLAALSLLPWLWLAWTNDR